MDAVMFAHLSKAKQYFLFVLDEESGVGMIHTKGLSNVEVLGHLEMIKFKMMCPGASVEEIDSKEEA